MSIYYYNHNNKPEIDMLKYIYKPYLSNTRLNVEDILYVCVFMESDVLDMIAMSELQTVIMYACDFIPYKVRDLMRRPNTFLLLFNSWETRNLIRKSTQPSVSYFITKKLRILAQDRVIISSCDFVNFNRSFSDLKYRLMSYDWQFVINKHNFDPNDIVSFDVHKNKHLVTLNRRGNLERLIMCLWLYTKHRDKCHMSFVQSSLPSYDKIKEWNDKMDVCVTQQEYDQFCKAQPLSLDSDSFEKVVWNTTKTIKQYLEDSSSMLVFETNAETTDGTDTPCQQISEKTYKPIKSGLPFLIFTGYPGILRHLKTLGFKTFEPYIDESYDDIKYDYNTRYKLLVKEIDRLCTMDTIELNKIYTLCIPIVKHNLEVLKSAINIPLFKI